MNLKKQIEEKVIKSFGLSDLALKNRITIVFLSLMLTILGLISYDRLPKESFPEVDQSNVIVGVPYPGNSPIDIENLIISQPDNLILYTYIYINSILDIAPPFLLNLVFFIISITFSILGLFQ